MWKSYVVLGVYLVGCVIVGLLIALLTPSECISKNCRSKGRLIMSDMASGVTPCDNFYQFVCQNYAGLHRNPNLDKGSVWKDIKEIQIRHLVDFLDKHPSKHDDRILRALKMVYTSCLNDKEIDKEGMFPIKRYIQLAEGFPLVQGSRWDINPSGKNRTWDEMEYSTRFAGFSGGHLLHARVDLQEVDGKAAYYIYLSIPHNLELDVTNEKYFYSYVEKISYMLNETKTERAQEIKDTLKFWQELANITVRPENCSYPIVIEELTSFVKEFDFLRLECFFNNMSSYVTLPTHIVVSYQCRQYLNALKSLVEKTPQRIIANYLMIENIIEVTSFLPQSMRDVYVEFLKKSKDPDFKVESSKKTLCAKAVKSKMSSALSALYIREHFPVYQEPTYLINTLVSIKNSVKRWILKLNWLSKKKKHIAWNKIDSLIFASPVPKNVHSQMMDLTSFRVHYEDLCFVGNTTSSLASYMALQQFATDKQWELLGRPPTVFDEGIDIFSGEITYDKKRNAIVIPMGFAKYPAFDKFWPYYLNYGGFGSEVAKKMMESVGEILQGPSRYKCFIGQYDQYVNEHIKVKVDDPACVASNVVQTAGVWAAYDAYVSHESERFFHERQLVGLQQYSPKQMYFLDFATFLCRNNRTYYKEGMTQYEVSDVPNEYQVNGALRNFEAFAGKFHCPADSYMNPSQRCKI